MYDEFFSVPKLERSQMYLDLDPEGGAEIVRLRSYTISSLPAPFTWARTYSFVSAMDVLRKVVCIFICACS